MQRVGFLLSVVGALSSPAVTFAQPAPEIWTVTSPLTLSQTECIRQANVSLQAQRWSITWTDGNSTNGRANNYTAHILCNARDRVVTFSVAGPSRARARSLAESLYRGNNVWQGSSAIAPIQPQPPTVSTFDEKFYLENNPDVAEAVRNRVFPSAIAHYNEFGIKEGRAPRFDEEYYLSRNPDVARAVRRGQFRNGREHWERLGKFEGRPGGVGTLGQPPGQLSN
ncbi:MAG: hypothetical protein ACK421_04920 [Pseudanabaenaceae cyanobacterium]